MSNCEICGEPMPPGEKMFKYHGYSGACPKPPLPKPEAVLMATISMTEYLNLRTQLTQAQNAIVALEKEKEMYRSRWLSCVTPEEAERLAALKAREASKP